MVVCIRQYLIAVLLDLRLGAGPAVLGAQQKVEFQLIQFMDGQSAHLRIACISVKYIAEELARNGDTGDNKTVHVVAINSKTTDSGESTAVRGLLAGMIARLLVGPWRRHRRRRC